ncbi:hypothetical protein LOCC1_G005368 [Lachnellula occidentalis]|uniref:ubiquitinyl hydrolase 1 n=1 Tax=Lachnellula occidentalis TaxID=215460 RepID=A0A8H8S2N0_9HELO|nr:hypothetical protein LOCC1_G005368 [Lachnellula occidentalis]
MDADVPVGLPLEYIINHVFLPPKLPQLNDTTVEVEVALTKLFHDTLNTFIGLLPEDDQDALITLPPMLSILLDDGSLGSPIRTLDQKLAEMVEGDVLALQITHQNAGLVLRRQAQTYSFETFELSATSKAVMGTIGRVVRRFPGPVIAVSDTRVRDRDFGNVLTQCLMSLESETLDDGLSKGSGTHKDTVHPQFATEWLPGILRGIGSPVNVSRIYKRTRDDVLWGSGLEPWRRSPRWILLRVVMQTSIASPAGDHTHYKIFMVYFMATVLDLAMQDEYSSDLLQIMLAKINRRIQKLDLTIVDDDVPWAEQAQDFVAETMEAARALLAKRWSTIQKSANSAGTFRLAELRKLKPHSDTILSLPKLRPYLQLLHNSNLQQLGNNTFAGGCSQRINGRGSSLPDPKSLDPKSQLEIRLSLMDLELWVSYSLESWLDQHIKSGQSVVQLARVIVWYMNTSITIYSGFPEGFSVMVLTLMLLWTALDKAVVSHHPLLSKFDPGFPTTLLDSLLLPKRHQMGQVRDIEKHLLKRKANSLVGNPSVFEDVSSPLSLGAQYFDQSLPHQNTKKRIEKEAKAESKVKTAELIKAKIQFSELMTKSNQLSCTTATKWFGRGRNREERTIHDPLCIKCQLRKEAQTLRISCYEWPLPASESSAKSVVFELGIPQLIRTWRSVTYRLLVDVLSSAPPPLLQGKRNNVILTEYQGLADYLTTSRSGRLLLVSSTKPFVQTQHASQTVSEATEDSVCLPNTLNFAMQDTKSQRGTSEYLNKYDIHERCTLKLPKGCYKTLQYAVNNTKHTSNEVISRQGNCPDGLTVHEVHAFAALRSGHRLQWLNIARELVSRTLDFGKEEVHLLLLQASWQAGPSALQQVSRDSHIELEEENFGQDLLSALEVGLVSVESNWQGSVAALTFISLAARLLSVSLHESVRIRCLQFLQKARYITIDWLRVVVKLLHDSSDVGDMDYLTLRVLDLALICHCTFDIDPRQLPSLLSSSDNVAILIETATIVDDRWPVSEEALTPLTRELLRRFSRTSHTLEPTLKHQIIASPDGIDQAIGRMWAGYEPGTPWVVVEAPDDRWLTTHTAHSDSVSSMAVHFNLLTGSLLINGLPKGRLPREYESSSTYQRLFGNKILEVVPSNRGLAFETRNAVHGFQVEFGLDGEELIVRARQGHEIYQVIPVHALTDDFPLTFVQNYIHWVHRGTMVIEWRPLESKWFPSSENWRISTPDDPQTSSLELWSRRLVDPESTTAGTIYRWLKPLESRPNINIYYNTETRETEIRLPRLNLDFILRKTGLESKQFRGMVIDTNQYIGTLHGLLHKLVLKDIQGPSRVAIIPHGTVSYHPVKHHVQVSISTGLGDKIPYHQFVIDKDLGLLNDNGNLRTRLFKLYLHALTSHCLPDSLTSRTGSEEALHGLRLASTRSFLSLDQEHVEQLKLFAKLTPAREFYPKGSKFMQTVNWENLSPLSHHEDFVQEARLMLAQAETFRVFQTASKIKYSIEKRGPSELRQRAAIRNAAYRVHLFGAENFTSNFDAIYDDARDSIPKSFREHEACYISTMVDQWTCRLEPYDNLLHQILLWRPFIYGPQSDFKFNFDKRWLESPSSFMPQYWCSIQQLLSKSDATKDKFRITIFLANLAHSKHGNIPLVHTLLALATAPALRNIQPPAYEHFDLSWGFEPDKAKLISILQACKVSFEESPERQIARLPNELGHDHRVRREAAYQAATKVQINKCLNDLMHQWPSKNIIRPKTPEIKKYLPGLKASIEEIRSFFGAWHKNFEFSNYIQEIQTVLDSLPRPLHIPAHYSVPPHEDIYQKARAYLKIDDLLQNPAPELPLPHDDLPDLVITNDQPEGELGPSKLKSLLTKLSKSAKGHYQKSYIKDLQKSHNAFLANSSASAQLTLDPPYTVLKTHLKECRENVESLYKRICSRLVISSSPVYDSARRASMLPRLSPSILLRLLARINPVALSAEWKAVLTRYALAIASMQRAERLVACGKRIPDILNELTNGGHTNWDPLEFPEWLLLELESNILIRPEQAQIAREMIAPQSGSNSIMQLNMGLGKSSVIVPIVAATLADQTKLARVVVLKSLSEQMFQLLVSKLGGLIGRRIYRLPISRSLAPSWDTANLIQKTYEECMARGGVLLVQPESLLSFELLGIDHLLCQELNPEVNLAPSKSSPKKSQEPSMYEIGKVMVQTQQWLYQHARDILDESDEILSVRFELIYTLGIQQNIQFSPDRWSIIQRVLGVLSETARTVLNEFPQGLEVIEGSPGAFPRIRILQDAAGKYLLNKVAQSICRSGMSSLAMWTFTEEERSVVFEYLTNLQIPKARAAILETRVFQTEFIKMSLLLLRGLFAAGVLEFVFAKKRWRVNYGLDLSRSMLAVPYHAKDNPSARSEFSHPDTAIALTCLSYYYGGLTDQQIRASFEELFLSDQAQEDYAQWIQHCEDLPKSFRQLTGVNLRNKQQCLQEVFPALRYSKGLIDYYLEHLVFPKEMKEFSNKLSSSGWEIARKKTHPTTGFSGTNDSKYMLPNPIKQCDLPEQLSTNAEVLACLLQPENSYDTVHTPQLETLNAAALIDMAVVMVPPIRVLLDVGAQLLEDNEKIATSWLSRVAPEDAQAVIFFHDNDIFVLNREGMKEPLLISPFAKQMDRCLVYLDEAHTRGTDLKMPADYRAIVTLGPDLTKDRVSQACKRLRKLGQGQSVVFCAPLEVQSKILEYSGKKEANLIEVEDVLLWTMRNSWDFTKNGMPLWATQGMRHYRRAAACDLSGVVPHVPVGILEPEALTLDERYGLDRQLIDERIVCRNRIQVDNDVTRTELCSIRAKCREFGLSSFGDSDLHEEQERELHPENEREQQVEPPLPTTPYKHTLHANIRQLVLTGELTSNEGLTQAFDVFRHTRARERLNVDDWPEDLLVSQDFAYTVVVPNQGNQDSFLRPVNWILSFKGRSGELKYLIISPFEVQELLPQMRGQNRVCLHVYSPRLSLSNRSLEDLSFCAVPPVQDNWSIPAISTTLNLFAGQLYLRDATEYRTLCRFLGVRFRTYQDLDVNADGFISPEARHLQDDETAAICRFNRSPIDFLRLVTTFRRLGQTFATSHVGKILSGDLVRAMDFDVMEDTEEEVDAMDIDRPMITIKREPDVMVE